MTGAPEPDSPSPGCRLARHRYLRRLLRAALAVTVALAGGPVGVALGQTTDAGYASPPTITVAGTWEGGSPASWSAYTAVVKNVGKEPFRGELVIGPADGGTAGIGAPAPGGGMGPAQPGAATALIGAPHHRSRLALDPGEERRVSALLVVSPVLYQAEVRDTAGQVTATTGPRPLTATNAQPVGLLSDSVTGRAVLLSGATGAALSDRFRSARDFPTASAFLRGLGAVVIADFDSTTLGTDQLDALRGFLQLGGSLVVAGGAAWERTVRPLPEDLTPLRPAAATTASLAPMADLAAITGDASVTVAVGDVLAGRTVLQDPQQIPLIVEKDYGAGRIIQLAFDPLVDLAALPSRTLAVLARDYALTRAGLGPSAQPGQAGTGPANGDGFLAILDAPRRERAETSPMAAVLVLYALLLGPLAYAAVRWRRRPGAVWSLTPLLAVGVAAAIWLASLPLKPDSVDHQLQVQRQAPGGTLLVESWHQLLPARSGDAELTLGPDVLAWTEPRPADPPLGLPPLISPLVAGRPVGGDDGPSTIRPGPPSRVEFGRWPVWARRTVRTSTVSRQASTLEAQLRVEAAMVVGRVTNRSNDTVRDLRIEAPDGTTAAVAETLQPNQSVDVQVKLVPAPPQAASAQPGSTAALGDLVVGQLVARPGEVDLVGVVPARPVLQVDGSTARTRAAAVLVATVRLQAADTLTAGLGAPRLVCACGAGGPLVYEVQLPPGTPGPLTVTMSPTTQTVPSDAVEAYHWPSRSWRPLTGTPARAGLEPGAIDGGLIRLRVRAPNAVGALRLATDGT